MGAVGMHENGQAVAVGAELVPVAGRDMDRLSGAEPALVTANRDDHCAGDDDEVTMLGTPGAAAAPAARRDAAERVAPGGRERERGVVDERQRPTVVGEHRHALWIVHGGRS
jgi:hypothetical protein